MSIYKLKIPKPILLFLILAVVLNILRIFLFKTTTSVYMFWNIFLASVPFFISYLLLLKTNKKNIMKPFFIVGFIFWIIFLPNAPYVITDFIHLGEIRTVPLMYDIFALLSSTLVSLFFGVYSLMHIEKILKLKFSHKITNAIIVVIILFTSFGMYLGRFLRFNSWDFFISHKFLLSSVWDVFTKSKDLNLYYYSILFFVFIYVSFISFKDSNIE